MGSVNISIKEEAYEYLRSLKKGDRSFSEIILDFKKERKTGKDLMKYFGALEDNDFSDVEKNMKNFRKDFNLELNKRTKNDRSR